jgi:hypothetical protein
MIKYFVNFLLAFVLLFGTALAHGQGHVPTTDQPFVAWTGIATWDYGNLQLNSAPPNCPSNQYVLGLTDTFAPLCGIPGGAAAFQTAVYPAVCQASGTIPSWCGAPNQTADVYVRAACDTLPSAGGTIDLKGLTGTLANSMPCSTPSKQVFIIQDTASLLTVTESDGGTVFPVDVYSGVIGLQTGTGQCQDGGGIHLGSGTNITSVVGTAHTDGTEEAFTATGLCIFGGLSATVSQGMIFSEGNFANTTISNNNLFECPTACIKLVNTQVELYNNWANDGAGGHTIVGSPLVIQSTGSAGCQSGLIHVHGGQYEHAVGGGPEIVIESDGGGALNCGIIISDLGIERNNSGTASAVGISIQDCWQCSVDGVTYTGPGVGSDAIKISESAPLRTQNVTLSSTYAGQGSPYANILNDTTPGGSVLSSTTTPQLTLYYSQPSYLPYANLPPTTLQAYGPDTMNGLGSFSTGSSSFGTDFVAVGCNAGTVCTYTRTSSTAPPGYAFSQEIQVTANIGGMNGVLYNPGVTLTAGVQYTAGFYAKSDGTFLGQPTFIFGNEASPPVFCYTETTTALTATWTYYTYTCIPTANTTSFLNIGTTSQPSQVGTFWLAGFTLAPLAPLTSGNFVGAVGPYGVSTTILGASIGVGAGAPTSTCGTAPTGNGSAWLRTDGTASTTLYLCASGTWTAVTAP